MAFISGQTNRRLGARPPSEYLPEVITQRGTEALESQLVPISTEVLTVDRYEEFLSQRRDALAEAMNAFVARKSGRAA
jgi:hypothetical protein